MLQVIAQTLILVLRQITRAIITSPTFLIDSAELKVVSDECAAICIYYSVARVL